jgi:hypothetical protein
MSSRWVRTWLPGTAVAFEAIGHLRELSYHEVFCRSPRGDLHCDTPWLAWTKVRLPLNRVRRAFPCSSVLRCVLSGYRSELVKDGSYFLRFSALPSREALRKKPITSTSYRKLSTWRLLVRWICSIATELPLGSSINRPGCSTLRLSTWRVIEGSSVRCPLRA